MEVIQIAYPIPDSIAERIPQYGQTIAIGDFDGVHLGHREVIGRAVAAGKRLEVPSSVMTFHPHPREVLGTADNLSYLTPLARKLEKFEELGVDTVYVVTFDNALAALSPASFVEQVLQRLRVKSVSVGFNFTFGHRGSGTAPLLRELGEGSFDVEIVEPYLVDGERVSSTFIREALMAGDVERAAAMLGDAYEVEGKVVNGEGRGRTIGMPTANLSVMDQVVKPENGVYAVTVTVMSGSDAGKRLRGVMNVGFKPTFHQSLPAPTWEVHLLDYSGDLYDSFLRVAFHARIRNERKFPSVDALIEQIHHDIEQAKRTLG